MSSAHLDARARRGPAPLAASLSASVSSGRAVLGAAKHKNWRANYLRALNIYTPDVDPARARLAADAAVARQRPRPTPAAATTASVPVAESATTVSRRRGLLGHSRAATDDARRSAASASSNTNSSASSGAGSAVSRLLGRHHARTDPADDKLGGYVFGVRSHLFRARRAATSASRDVLVVDRVSAPIEIPTAHTPTRQCTPLGSGRGSKRASPASADCGGRSKPQQLQQQDKPPRAAQLLSWEEPSVMLGDGGWPLEVDKPHAQGDTGNQFEFEFESHDLPFVVRRSVDRRGGRSGRYCGAGIPEDEGEDSEDDETLDLDRAEDGHDDQDDDQDDDEDDDIFKMDELGDSDGDKPGRQQQQMRRTGSGRLGRDPFLGGEYRAVSGRRRGSVPATGRGGGGAGRDDEFRALPESFVPPHQLVERDCFSLGLRDELKRRPLRT